MKITLRRKLAASFLAVIALTGVFGVWMSLRLIGDGILREAQGKVALDLNTASLVYQGRLEELRRALELTAAREHGVIGAMQSGNLELLKDTLTDVAGWGG